MKRYDAALRLFAGLFSILFIVFIVTQLTTIIPFEFSSTGTAFVVVPVDNLLQSLSESLWGPRLVETLAQVVILFVAAAGAAALFRLEKRSSVESEAKKTEGQ